jgi:hydrogenase-4 component C
MIEFVTGILQALLVVLIAPFISGVARCMRAKMHSRRGPNVWQDYHDLVKLLKRPDISSAHAGPIFRYMPLVMFTTMFVVAMGLPMLLQKSPVPALGDIITIIYLFALSRFFFSLAAVDSGSSYSGTGGIRELIVGVLVEPIMLLSLFVVALIAGTTSVEGMGQQVLAGDLTAPIAVIVAGLAFAYAVFMELGKVPYDLAEAEQELQEGPLTEYSGPSFALLKTSVTMKQILVVSWFIAVFLPFGSAGSFFIGDLALGLVAFLVKLFVIFLVINVIENSVTRVRYKLVAHQTWISVGVAALSFVFFIVGL